MIETAKLAIKDRPGTWSPEFIQAPAGVDVSDYQQRLNKIAGLTTTGEPVLRLVWGGSASEIKFNDWDPFGNPTGSQIIPRHAILRFNQILGVNEKIPIRRWIIEQNSEPAQYNPDDNSDLFFSDANGNRKLMAEKPRSGYFTPLVVIGDHSKCPADCNKQRLCLGDYKQPGGAELNWVAETTFKILTEKNRVDPRRALTAEAAAQIVQAARDKQGAAAIEKEQQIDDFAKDHWNAHRHRLTSDDPSVLAHGRFHFLGGKQTLENKK